MTDAGRSYVTTSIPYVNVNGTLAEWDSSRILEGDLDPFTAAARRRPPDA